MSQNDKKKTNRHCERSEAIHFLQKRKFYAFSLAGTLTLLVVVSVLLIAITPTITKMLANISTNYGATVLGGTKGRYEVWREEATAENKRFIPSSENKNDYIDSEHDNTIIFERYCGRFTCHDKRICKKTGCKFNPPADARNFKIYAVGGGGAGGSSGNSAVKDFNDKKIGNASPESGFFSVIPNGSLPDDDESYENPYINTFPHQKYRKTTTLGSATQNAQYEDMAPWFSFDTLLKQKIKIDGINITNDNVIGVACGGAGGDGQGLKLITNTEENPLIADNGCKKIEGSCTNSSSSSLMCNYTNCHTVSDPGEADENGNPRERQECDPTEYGYMRTCNYHCSCYDDLYEHRDFEKTKSTDYTCSLNEPSTPSLTCSWLGKSYTANLEAGYGGSAASCVYVKTKINQFLNASVTPGTTGTSWDAYERPLHQ